MKRCEKVKYAQIRFTESSAAAFVEAFRHQPTSFSFQHMEALQFVADGPSTGEGSMQMALCILAVASPKSQGLQILHSHRDIASCTFMQSRASAIVRISSRVVTGGISVDSASLK